MMKLRLIRKQKPLDTPYWFTERQFPGGDWSMVTGSLFCRLEDALQHFDKLVEIGDQPDEVEVIKESP